MRADSPSPSERKRCAIWNRSLIMRWLDAVEDIGVVFYQLDPETEHGDAEPRQFLRGSGFDFLFDLEPAERDGWEDADCAGGAAFEGLVVQWLAVLVGAHDFDKVVFGDGVARFAAENVFEARLGAALIVQTHEISLRIFDAPTRECDDVNVCLVPCGDGNRSALPFQKALVETVHALHQWCLEMQTRLGNRIADRFSELRNDHLFGLVNRIDRTGKENEEQNKGNGDNRCWKPSLFHHGRPSPGLVESGRIGSRCRRDSSRMIFCPL